jgi:hypothetical protein
MALLPSQISLVDTSAKTGTPIIQFGFSISSIFCKKISWLNNEFFFIICIAVSQPIDPVPFGL